MRKIKFRAWNKETKTFGYFGLENSFISGNIRWGECYSHINTWRYKKGASGNMGMYWEFDIDEGEVENYEYQQYTGLKDKNYKEIYEGDIVIGTVYDGNKSFIGNPLEVRYMVLDSADGCYRCGFNLADSEFEIIGNIYENPELLEDKK